MTAPASHPNVDHLVVLMFENRSFDNLLGHLYPPGSLPEGQHFDGVANGQYSNPSPTGPIAAHIYQGPTDQIFRSPTPDPGEEYQHVNTQLFGIVDPPANAELDAEKMLAPWNNPPAGLTPTMDGFVADYRNNFFVTEGRQPTPEEYSVIMGGFSADMLPVMSTLAREFAVYDRWFCAVPSQTVCNRSFFHASTSSGFVTNKCGEGYKKWKRNSAPTIFNRLEDAGIPWAVYYDETQVASLTGVFHAPSLEPYWQTRFFGMDRFYSDVANGTLPAYSFIEPRIVFNQNDMHPLYESLYVTMPDGSKEAVGVVNDVRAGEKLLHEVYSAIRASATPDGSNNQNTMLLVTFDEHGGCYDHVPPPAAVPPDPVGPDGSAPAAEPEMGFGFDRLGVRVPAIAISAWTKSGTIIHDEMHHGAVIATLCRKHGLPPLTKRDLGANDLTNALNLAEPRPTADWPHTTAQYVPPNPEAGGPFTLEQTRAPLTAPGVLLMGMLAARYGKPGEPTPTTYGEAYEMLRRCQGIFGR